MTQSARGSDLSAALQHWDALVLDGAMATELERHGADLSGGLWSARVLAERPELVARVHHDYLEAGADLATTASYQASVAGFVRAGVRRPEAVRLIQSSISLAVSVRDAFWAGVLAAGGPGADRPRPLVATSVGPYGAVLADGSEYRGHYGVGHRELVRFHRERLQVLVDGGAELLACETIPSLVEAEALVEALSGWPQLSAWMSFSARGDGQVADGTPVAACGAYLDDVEQVVAVGVNCTAVEHVTPLLRELAGSTPKPLVAYPNSGEAWDARRQTWTGPRSAVDPGDRAREWYAAGARLVGGCCRTRPDDIAALAAAFRGVRTG